MGQVPELGAGQIRQDTVQPENCPHAVSLRRLQRRDPVGTLQ